MGRLKRLFVVLFILSFMVVLTGCSADASVGNESDGNMMEEDFTADDKAEHIPELSQVQGICELVTLDCYYHNVAKSVKEPGSGVLHFGEKERPFWMEYTGIAEISFRSDLIKMEQHGKEIIIILPSPEVNCRVEPDSWNEDSYIISKDQWVQKNPITAEDQTQAIEAAQADMQEKVVNNPSILDNARRQAKDLIENYVCQVGRVAGVEYHVTWNDGNIQDRDEQSSAEELDKDGEADEGRRIR